MRGAALRGAGRALRCRATQRRQGHHQWGVGPKRAVPSTEGAGEAEAEGNYDLLPADRPPDLVSPPCAPPLPSDVPQCQLHRGDWKYLLLEVTGGGLKEPAWYVSQTPCRKCAAAGMVCDRSCFHKRLANGVVAPLQDKGFKVWWPGGGWIDYDPGSGTAHVYGMSIACGAADHFRTREVLQAAFPGLKVTAERYQSQTEGRQGPRGPPVPSLQHQADG
eukprot:TRINITY_DN12081_c0_g1_i1.p2 TRINITY_DN12081_c0_g1~~TRINITY_DN12081_c0_g1_i1.p2  ORF type:complete len:251 (+),score=70.92 TRINITY_DN12081_c0_g1_i1:98-754(+)